MNFKRLLPPILLILLCFSCQDKQKQTIRLNKTPISLNKPSYFITSAGDSIPTGVPIPARGTRIDPDSLPKPKIIPLQSKPEVVPFGHANVHPVGEPKVVQIPKKPTVLTPGKNGINEPVVVPARGKIVPAYHPPLVPALPLQMKDAAITDIRYMDVDNGLNSYGIWSILEDSRGYLWFGTTSGVSRYDGTNFIHYTSEEGLFQNGIRKIIEDSRGNLWFGSHVGLSKYDGTNFVCFTTEEGLQHNEIRAILEDSRGDIWFGGRVGISKYDGTNFVHYTSEDELIKIATGGSMSEDSRGNIWFGTQRGAMRYDPKEGDHGSFTRYTTEEGMSANWVRAPVEDAQGNLWFGSVKGVNKYDSDDGNWGTFTHFTGSEGLNGEMIRFIKKDSRGNFWFSSYLAGVVKYDPDDGNLGSFTNYSPLEGLSHSNVISIEEDSKGKLWFATLGGGISRYGGAHFSFYTRKQGLNSSHIRYIYEDSHGHLWFETIDGVSCLDGEYITHYTEKEGLIVNRITSQLIMEDKRGNLWFGGRRGVWMFNPENRASFTHYTTNEDLGFSNVKPLLEDSRGNLWFKINNGGLMMVKCNPDGEWDSVTTYTTNEGLTHNNITAMITDNKGNIWFGTSGGGVTRYEPNKPTDNQDGGSFTHYTTNEGLTHNEVRDILVDDRGKIWIATLGGGVCRFDGKNFTRFTTEEGFCSNRASFLVKDSLDNIWVSTDKGIALITPLQDNSSIAGDLEPDDYRILLLGKADGLKWTDGGPIFLDSQNRIWWGSDHGLTILDLNQIELPKDTPIVRLNSLEIEQTFVDFRSLSDTSYQSSLSFGSTLAGTFDSVAAFYNYPIEMALPFRLNHLTFHFSAIDWAAPHQLKYSFFLEGLENKWSPLSPENKADYRNIPSGTYTFKVKAIGAAQNWSVPFQYTFTILPPWWLTWWAYLLYLLIIAFLLYRAYRYLLARKLEQAEVERLQELDAYKTRLYTNITHEFRTPLTIILGMARQIKGNPKKWYSEGLKMITRNGRQLLNLVNQVLDLNKLDKDKLKLQMQRGEVVAFIHYLVQSFESFAEGKNIQLHFNKEVDSIEMDFDSDQLTKIVSNLLSNAIKYTLEGGQVYVSVRSLDKKGNISGTLEVSKILELRIRDTGPGIPAEELPRIFDRFYQVDDSATRNAPGTGIGLALVKELTRLMGGEIQAQSKVGEGTTFSVLLPVQKASKGSSEFMTSLESKKELSIITESELVAHEQPIFGVLDLTRDSELPTILLIEDNTDVLTYLASCLEAEYQLEFAQNGEEGIERALEVIPDIIISDIMMPEKDGYEVCMTLKEDFRTSHIPIILLTAKADRDAKLEGLKAGADAYLSKPFDKEELDIRLQKLLELRQQLQARYSRLTSIPEVEEKTLSKEEVFLENLFKTVENNLSDENFGISQLCRAIGMSRTQLHRKIKALTGRSTSIYIRTARLEKAKKLLQTTDLNISEVAYAAGFRTLAYFSRLFTDEVGERPSDFRKKSEI